MNGCVISALMTGAGKTTVSLGLLAALRKRGIAVQPFKIGPDFIDPGLHRIAAGVVSHNLDGWMVSREANRELFAQAAAGCDFAVVEGMMGLFDGFDGTSESGSTAEMAKWLGLPVILVIDAQALGRSAAALVRGARDFDPEVKIAGIIFNRVAGEGHFTILSDAVKDMPILGWLPLEPSIVLPERHLGLVTGEEELAVSRIRAIGDWFEQHIDVDLILKLGPRFKTHYYMPAKHVVAGFNPRSDLRIALAHDKAFSFYYEANRLALEASGAKIIEFSPLNDSEMPMADFLYIGGGYPELYSRELEANTTMRSSIRHYIESGGRFYAECGGLMYLAESIDGSRMTGILPIRIEMTGRLVDFGYCELETNVDSILGPAATTARGHQFHYSRVVGEPGSLYTVRQGSRKYFEGFVLPNGVASYVHLHFLSNPALARNMLNS